MSKIKQAIFYLRTKGWRWLYNYLHFITFYDTQNKWIIKYLHWRHPYPSYIEVETTTRCPLKCTFCEHTYWNEPSRDMDIIQFKHIIDQFPKLKWVGLTGIGEEFINPDFMDMIRYVKEKNPAIFIELYDSFLFLDKVEIEHLIDLGVERIFVSLDAATKETYEKVRVGANWERVLGNIKTFVEEREWKTYLNKKTFPTQLCFHYIVTKDNFHEMKKFIELVHSLNTDVKLVQFSRMLHYFPEVENLFTEVPDKEVEKINNRAKELGIEVVWSLDIPMDKPPVNMCVTWEMPFIFWNGDVICCCATNEQNRREFQHTTSFGNLLHEDFKDIWKGQKYKKFRNMIRENKVPSQCRTCSLFNTK